MLTSTSTTIDKCVVYDGSLDILRGDPCVKQIYNWRGIHECKFVEELEDVVNGRKMGEWCYKNSAVTNTCKIHHIPYLRISLIYRIISCNLVIHISPIIFFYHDYHDTAFTKTRRKIEHVAHILLMCTILLMLYEKMNYTDRHNSIDNSKDILDSD